MPNSSTFSSKDTNSAIFFVAASVIRPLLSSPQERKPICRLFNYLANGNKVTMMASMSSSRS
jgi:hypothetical protein